MRQAIAGSQQNRGSSIKKYLLSSVKNQRLKLAGKLTQRPFLPSLTEYETPQCEMVAFKQIFSFYFSIGGHQAACYAWW